MKTRVKAYQRPHDETQYFIGELYSPELSIWLQVTDRYASRHYAKKALNRWKQWESEK